MSNDEDSSTSLEKNYVSESQFDSKSKNETIHKNFLFNKEKLKNMFQNKIKYKAYIEKMISSILKDVENKMKIYSKMGLSEKKYVKKYAVFLKNTHKK